MDFTSLSDATHVSASFSLDSAVAPLPEINVICRLEATTDSPELAVDYTAELFDALCDAYDADVLGASLPLPEAWAPARRDRRPDRVGAAAGRRQRSRRA